MMSATALRLHSSTASRSGRFQPGALIAGRYQIIGLLGKGGMGEVYRANDLTLDQQVALKFLPEEMSSNSAMLGRFHGEVRIARQVSHTNVCRVYDIGEVDGHLFLSMEYVDGEDLGSLLRRIGRLPADKATEFARKICAGLAAAHNTGVLHRDLKPANIMIDGQGRVVIMDFGLAAVSDQVQGMEIRAGTPAYMSPEQLAGLEVTVRSDIYALGLVMYEMYTGKRPFECESMAELMRLQHQSQAPSILTTAKDVDPLVEKVIARCLSPDAKSRPASALAVAAALPGGDPLAAALAAGETPSPELVAASGANAGMRPRWAIACGVAVLFGLAAMLLLGPWVRVTGVAPLELPPEALTLKAREYAQSFGYTQKPADSENGFIYDNDYLSHLTNNDKSAGRWSRLSLPTPPAIVFWYRQSPRYLEQMGNNRGVISPADPPENISGMLSMQLDPRGRLIAFTAVPPQVETAPAPSAPVDWKPLLAAAGLDTSQLKDAEPQWTPPSMADTRAAWTGTWPGQRDVSLRVEAAAWRGKPVYFDLIGPWTRPARMQARALSVQEKAALYILLFFAVVALLGAALLARYNMRRGRGDQRGAIRIAAFAFLLELFIWVLRGHHVPTAGEVGELFQAISLALLIAAALWVGYMALEPYVRRHWPQALVSWSRLVAGGWRDPLVGRDILIGVVAGLFWAVIWAGSIVVNVAKAGPATTALLSSLSGGRQTVATALAVLPGSLIQLFVCFLMLFVARLLLRREWLAAVAYIALFTALGLTTSTTPLFDAPVAIVLWTTIYLAISRFGFIAFVTAIYVNTLFVLLPVTGDFSVWYSGISVFVVLLVASIAAFGAHTALAGRSLIQDELL